MGGWEGGREGGGEGGREVMEGGEGGLAVSISVSKALLDPRLTHMMPALHVISPSVLVVEKVNISALDYHRSCCKVSCLKLL